jgi:hypothetical protein
MMGWVRKSAIAWRGGHSRLSLGTNRGFGTFSYVSEALVSKLPRWCGSVRASNRSVLSRSGETGFVGSGLRACSNLYRGWQIRAGRPTDAADVPATTSPDDPKLNFLAYSE